MDEKEMKKCADEIRRDIGHYVDLYKPTIQVPPKFQEDEGLPARLEPEQIKTDLSHIVTEAFKKLEGGEEK